MKLFYKDKTQANIKGTYFDLTDDERHLNYLKNYTKQLDSLLLQSRISKEDYDKELMLISNEVGVMEKKLLGGQE